MKIRRYSLSNILLYAITFFTLLFIQHIAILGSNPTRNMNVAEWSIFFGVIVILSAIYFFFEFKYKRLKVNKLLLCSLLLLLLLSVIATFIFPSEIRFSTLYDNSWYYYYYVSTSMNDRIFNIFVNISVFYFIYLILGVLPQKIHNLRQLNLMFYGFAITALVAFIYSCFSDFELYKELFSGNAESYAQIGSFTNNANNYASLLFYGVISSLFLIYTTNKKWFYIPAILFAVVSIGTLSRANIIFSFFVIAAFAIIRMILDFNNHKKVYLILIFSIGGFIILFILCYAICSILGCANNFLPFRLINMVIDKFVKGDNGRSFLWEQAFNIIQCGSCWALGCGFLIFTNSVYTVQCELYGHPFGGGSPHNGLLQIIGNNGIVFLIFLVICLVYLAYCLVKIFKKNKVVSLFTIILFVVFALEMINEGPSFLTPGMPVVAYFFMSVVTFIPILSIYYHQCHTEVNNEIIGFEYKLQKISKDEKPMLYSKLITFILCFASSLFAGVLMILLNNLFMKIISFVFIALTFIVPLIIELIFYKKINFKKYIFDVLLPYGCYLLTFVFASHLCLLFLEHSELLFGLLIVFNIAAYISLFLLIPWLKKKTGIFGICIDYLTNLSKNYCFKYGEIDKNKPNKTLIEKIEIRLHLRKAD